MDGYEGCLRAFSVEQRLERCVGIYGLSPLASPVNFLTKGFGKGASGRICVFEGSIMTVQSDWEFPFLNS